METTKPDSAAVEQGLSVLAVLVQLLALALIAWAVSWWSVPAACIVAGAALIAAVERQ